MNSNLELKFLKGIINFYYISKVSRMPLTISLRQFSGCSNYYLFKRKMDLTPVYVKENILNLLSHRTYNLSSEATTTSDFSSTRKRNSKIREVLTTCSEVLETENIEDGRLDAEYIVACALGVERHLLESMLEEDICSDASDRIDQMIGCRLARMPLQYIIGNWDFHSITLKLHPPVFIPRPETEELVNISLKCLEKRKNPLALDLGCGSGAISLALLHNNPQLKCVAVDQSKYAVQLTNDNAANLQLIDRISVIKGKIEQSGFPALPYEKFDLIVSNPPYVLKKDLLNLQPEIFLYEDLRGLDGGIDGLDIVKNIITNGQYLLKNDGVMLLEIDPCHQYLLPKWLESNKTALQLVKFYNDFHDVCRFAELRLERNNAI